MAKRASEAVARAKQLALAKDAAAILIGMRKSASAANLIGRLGAGAKRLGAATMRTGGRGLEFVGRSDLAERVRGGAHRAHRIIRKHPIVASGVGGGIVGGGINGAAFAGHVTRKKPESEEKKPASKPEEKKTKAAAGKSSSIKQSLVKSAAIAITALKDGTELEKRAGIMDLIGRLGAATMRTGGRGLRLAGRGAKALGATRTSGALSRGAAKLKDLGVPVNFEAINQIPGVALPASVKGPARLQKGIGLGALAASPLALAGGIGAARGVLGTSGVKQEQDKQRELLEQIYAAQQWMAPRLAASQKPPM
jgi:hypothetical protein